MPLINVLCDVKVWILLGVVLALGIGFDNPNASTILMFVLIAQMAVSLTGSSSTGTISSITTRRSSSACYAASDSTRS